MTHDLPAIVSRILDEYQLPTFGMHGIVHWARVFENALRIAEENVADVDILTLFALFHDSKRVNDGQDDEHGLRGAMFAESLRGDLVHLDDARFEILFESLPSSHRRRPND